MGVEVKICGVTRLEDGERAVALGAGFIGLNFWPSSSRYVTPSRARRIADAVRGRAEIVGVFVDATDETIEAVDGEVGLDRVQFHGSETPGQVARYGDRAIKAFRGCPSAQAAEPYDEAWSWLVDADVPDRVGGSGVAWNWTTDGLEKGRRIFVAGGIGPANVAEAASCGAWGVDVCSGVESAPGIKDAVLLRRLFEAVANG